MHGDDKFAQAARLYDGVGNFELGDGRTVRDACRLVGNVSLWDCLSTYLILYRFPMCVSGGAGLAHSYTERVRPLGNPSSGPRHSAVSTELYRSRADAKHAEIRTYTSLVRGIQRGIFSRRAS